MDYSINVSYKTVGRNPLFPDHHHYCRIELPARSEIEALEYLRAMRERFEPKFELTLSGTRTIGQEVGRLPGAEP